VNGHAPEKGHFPATENRVNGYAPEKGARERVCSGIWVVLFQFFVFSSCLKPIFRANGHEKRGFEWSTFSLKLKCFYSKVGGYTPEYVKNWASLPNPSSAKKTFIRHKECNQHPHHVPKVLFNKDLNRNTPSRVQLGGVFCVRGVAFKSYDVMG
jgi:hypothetical protein